MIRPGTDPAALAEAVRLIQQGELLGLPTETVYGLAADASNDAAVAKIFAAKGRPVDHPLIVHVADASQVPRYARDVPAFAQRLIAAFWPGPLTLILPRQPGVATAATGGQDSVGLRCPSHPVSQAVLKACGTGVAAPSANRFGRISPTTAQHVQDELGDALLILDGGPCNVGIESTIVDCTRGQPVLLRPGAISAAQLEKACGQAVLCKDVMVAEMAQAAPRASGTLESHYAPDARLSLMDTAQLREALAQLQASPEASSSTSTAVYLRSNLPLPPGLPSRLMPSDAETAAQQLFAVLRELDAMGISRIWVEAPPADAAWDGVRDRLTRAAA